MTGKRIWIMDGHNIIFAIPSLQRLQVSDRRDEARQGLADRLERFAHARGEKVLVVFDGNELSSSPDTIQRPLFEIVYMRRGEGVADDRIIYEARQLSEQGRPVTVVTNDVSTLAGRLLRGVDHLGVQEFWLKHIDKPPAAGGKRVEGDFSDVESEMLAQATAAESAPRAYGTDSASRIGGPLGIGASAAASWAGHGSDSNHRDDPNSRQSAEEALRERLRRKRERGRLRQERRLKRRPKPGRRR